MNCRLARIVFAAGSMAALAAAQGSGSAFEVASVKQSKSNDDRWGFQTLPGGRFVATSLPVLAIIAIAYDLPIQSDRVTGGPDWIRKIDFDIDAKAGEGAIPPGATIAMRDEKIRAMLQTLLADRFKLVIRRETKERPVYAIVVARNGPKLGKPIEEKDCSDNSSGPALPPCHVINGGQGRGLHAQAVTLADVATFVGNWTDRPVIDKSGLTGLYKIQTEGWAPLRPRPPRTDGADPTAEETAIADPIRPTIFQIFDRLGLKLDPQRAPVETFTIESVEHPTGN